MKAPDRKIRAGEVYMMMFDGSKNEQKGWRPGIIVQNNKGNMFSPNIIAIPLTTSMKKMGQPTHVFLSSYETGLPKDSVALCECPESVSKSKIGEHITTLSESHLEQVATAFLCAISLIAFINVNKLQGIWKNAVSLNAVY